MAKQKKLSPAEWQIMDGVWDLGGEVTVREVHGHLYAGGEKAYTTVQTIMNILADKGFLQRQKKGPVNFYRAKYSRDDMARMETKSLVGRIFDGSFGALAAHLINSGELSEEELAAIKKLIEEKERGGQ